MVTNSNKEAEEKKWLDEASSAYWTVAVNGILDVVINSRNVWHGQDSILYRKERESMERYISPFYWGLGTAVFLFVNFRVTGSRRFHMLRERLSTRKRTGDKNPLPSLSRQADYKETPLSYLERQRHEREKEAIKAVKLLTDMLVSLSVGTSATLLLLDAEKESLRKDFEDSPLVSGRSLIADSACSGFLTASAHFPLQPEQHVGNKNLASFAAFTTNCRRRLEYEKVVREKLGTNNTNSVVVPYPGVKNMSSTTW